jgi:hypothetical protein
MAVTIEQVEDALSRTIIGRPPKEVIIIDGVIDVNKGDRIATAIAMIRDGAAVFTPFSRTDSIFHETLHQGILGLGVLRGETIADVGGKLLALKYRLFPGMKKREVKYQETGAGEEILSRVGLMPAFEGRPIVRHYVLID